MFQRKIDETFKEVPNVFGIADNILVVWNDVNGKDHDETLQRVLQICRQVNLKVNKDKCYSGVHQSHFWGNHILTYSETRSTEAEGTHGDAPSKKPQKSPSSIPWNNYLGKFSPSTANICEPLPKPTSSKTLGKRNVSYQILIDKAKSLIKDDVCMKFYNETQPCTLQTNASGIGLRAALSQTRDGTNAQET